MILLASYILLPVGIIFKSVFNIFILRNLSVAYAMTWLSKSYSLSLANKIPSFLGRPCTISRKWIIIGPVIKILSGLSHSCFLKLPCEGSHRTSVGPWGTWRILGGYLSPLQLKRSNPSPPAAFSFSFETLKWVCGSFWRWKSTHCGWQSRRAELVHLTWNYNPPEKEIHPC